MRYALALSLATIVACAQSGGDDTAAAGTGGFNPTAAGRGGSDACATHEHQAVSKPVNLYIMFDKSSSMAGNKWEAAKTGLAAFVADEASSGIAVALRFFPRDVDATPVCDRPTYATPTVDFVDLPAGGGASLPGVDQSVANVVAAAGGTEEAVLVGSTNVAVAFQNALALVSGNALPCRYELPEEVLAAEVGLGFVNITITPPPTATARDGSTTCPAPHRHLPRHVSAHSHRSGNRDSRPPRLRHLRAVVPCYQALATSESRPWSRGWFAAFVHSAPPPERPATPGRRRRRRQGRAKSCPHEASPGRGYLREHTSQGRSAPSFWRYAAARDPSGRVSLDVGLALRLRRG